MHSLDLIVLIAIVAGVTQWLRVSLATAAKLPKWDKVLSKLWLGSILYLGLAQIPALELSNDYYTKIVFAIYLYTVYLLRDYRPARLFFLALLPFGIVTVLIHAIRFLAPGFEAANKGIISTAAGFSTFWLIGFGIYALVQNSKERKLRLKQEEEARAAEAQKLQLERLVAERTTELTLQKEKLEQTLHELKAAQAQLIQSEKLASLGELTAGIAHEIQNPLNFVNNFSELSVDLAEELKEELEKEPMDKAMVTDLMNDLTSNQQKINHHGKRAASIVTGMLQHARTNTGERQPTDLNALADEYLRLAYHGLRAKDSTFNAKMETDFDPAVGKVEVIPQDIGRVFLNIINNAFYATQQRNNVETLHATSLQTPYEPTVSISSRLVTPLGSQGAGQVIFKIKDNGTGIPEAVKVKIFQPFFTTKPTGQGTGLGLSLAYDIVTKGHGGTLEVVTKEDEGTAFIIHLPC